jgi:hypothetical protein
VPPVFLLDALRPPRARRKPNLIAKAPQDAQANFGRLRDTEREAPSGVLRRFCGIILTPNRSPDRLSHNREARTTRNALPQKSNQNALICGKCDDSGTIDFCKVKRVAREFFSFFAKQKGRFLSKRPS